MRQRSVTVLAIGLSMCAIDEVPAQARGQTPQRSQEREQEHRRSGADTTTFYAEDSWLRRLVGRFDLEVTHTHAQTRNIPILSGAADCTGVGRGSGVQCVVSVVSSSGEIVRTYPRITLLGINPVGGGLLYMEVDFLSRAEVGHGALSGNRVVIRIQCPKIADSGFEVVDCRRVIRFNAPQHKRFFEISVETFVRHIAPGGTPVNDSPLYTMLRFQRRPAVIP